MRCYEPSLFGKTGKNFVKCMNCYSTSCKFCGKEYKIDHFDITGFNYCKIFFRKKCEYTPSQKISQCKESFVGILMFILGYFVFILGVFKYISNFWCFLLQMKEEKILNRKSDESDEKINFCVYFAYVIVMILSIIVITPLLLFLISVYFKF